MSSTDHAAGRIPKWVHFRKAYTKGIPSCARGGFPVRPARCLSLLLYSPGSHGGHIKWPPARAELATNLNSGPAGLGIRCARRGNVPFQKGTGLFGWFYLGKCRAPALVRSPCCMQIKGVFGSMRQILNLLGTQGFCDDKPAGRALEHMRCGRPIKILPHTSEIQTNIAQKNRPFTAKKAASPRRKRPQALRIDDGKGYFRFGLSC